MNFDDVFIQVFQPYFYYSIILLVVSFICIKITLKCCPFLGSKIKSLLYLIPVAAPLLVMAYFPPKAVMQAISCHYLGQINMPTAPAFFSYFPGSAAPTTQTFTLISYSTTQILSVTGIICITGLALAAVYAVTTLIAGNWLASRVLHVITLEADEYNWLQTEIKSICKRLNIKTPKVGLVEDLRPNAFTMGYGVKTRLVFTVGLLNLLNHDEILAVAAHELAHVKNHDFLFKTLSNSITAASFFNPLAYFSLFNSQREREMLADENGAKLLRKPDTLANALTKITHTLKSLPGESRITRLTSNLLVTSPIIHRPQILSSHPKIDLRLKNINQLRAKPRRLKPSKFVIALALTCIVAVAGVTATFALANLQNGYVTPKNVLAGSTSTVETTVNYVNHIVFINEDLISNETIAHIQELQNINVHNATQTQPNMPSATYNQTQAFYILPSSNLPNPAYPMGNQTNQNSHIKY